MGRPPGAKNKPRDYDTPMGDVLRQTEAPEAEAIEEDQAHRFDEASVKATVRYMGDSYETINFYGQLFNRNTWSDITDPFIAKKATNNPDFDVKGRDGLNEERAKLRAQRDKDRIEYNRQQEAKYMRAGKNADSVLGRD